MKQPYRSPEQRRQRHADRIRRLYHSSPTVRGNTLARKRRQYRERCGGYTHREQARAAEVTFVYPVTD